MDEKSLAPLLALIIYILAKDVIVPLLRRRNHVKNNPIDISRFYQEFKDFKEAVNRWIEKAEQKIEKLDERLDREK
jgi:hypothetical protein